MSVEFIEIDNGKAVEVHATGKLTGDDYQAFVPEFERLVTRHGKISVLLEMRDFHGWDASGLWQDIKFDLRHFADIDKLAMVGDRKWESWMSEFCRPFTRAEIRYFNPEQEEQARAWVTQN